MNLENSIEALNTLIEINNDRIEGYKTAIEETEETDLKALFFDCVHTSEICKSELVIEVQKLKGTPMEGTKTTGKMYRIWMNFKALVSGKSRSTILNSCLYGEEVAADTYSETMAAFHEDLTDNQKILLETHLEILKVDHDKVKGFHELAIA